MSPLRRSAVWCCFVGGIGGVARSSGFELDHTGCCVSETVRIESAPVFVFEGQGVGRLLVSSAHLRFLSLVCRALPLISLFSQA